jgi:cysteinyl-tRNA synthetase
MAGARIEVNPNKRNAHDFALWRAAKPGDLQQWDSPWGRGNPGWHIECSAMSMQYLGETFDLHSGGEDHLFPHHECEIAQSEAATGKTFARYWMHNRFLKVDSAKMAKSAGGFWRLADIKEWGFDPLAFRLLMLGTSYRKGLDFTEDGLAGAQSRLDRWRSLLVEAKQATPDMHLQLDPDPRVRAFTEALADDFNTPKALAVAEEAIAILASPNANDRAIALNEIGQMDRVLGLDLMRWAESALYVDPDAKALLDERDRARRSGDYKRSDELREELRGRGYLVKDTKEGQRWERIRKKDE